MNKRQKSAARKRTFRSEQTDEAKADASAQLQARMTAHRKQQSEEEKYQATLSNTSARFIARGDLTPAEQKEASDRDRARLQALRNSQSEEEKEQASEEAQARMAALRGNQTPAEQKEATNTNSSRKRLQRELLSPEQKQSKADLASSIKPFHGKFIQLLPVCVCSSSIAYLSLTGIACIKKYIRFHSTSFCRMQETWQYLSYQCGI